MHYEDSDGPGYAVVYVVNSEEAAREGFDPAGVALHAVELIPEKELVAEQWC